MLDKSKATFQIIFSLTAVRLVLPLLTKNQDLLKVAMASVTPSIQEESRNLGHCIQ
ncbi:unnamed protein product [Meloidogyne enterolobii]|uniref:Uncharacterized protein n=1 Tax=Meloidogyne enterolobii TaxID=390850 RepID=A0ACB0ZDT6_MELEN